MGPGFEAAQRYLDQGARCEALTPTPDRLYLDEGARDDAHHVVQEAVALRRDGDHAARTLHRALQAQ